MANERLIELLFELEDFFASGSMLDLLNDSSVEVKCWELMNCSSKRCPAYGKTNVRCWHVRGTFCNSEEARCDSYNKWKECKECITFKTATTTNEQRVQELINNIVYSIQNISLNASVTAKRIRERLPAISEEYNLTTREVEVLLLLLDKASRKNIAKELSISAETVKMHIKNVYKKLQVGSIDELIGRVIQ